MGEEKQSEWKRRAVATCDVEITGKSASAVRLAYVSVASDLEMPRYLMGAGYHDQRREWIGVIAGALQKGWPIPEGDFLEIVAMLKKVADGEPPAKAFGLHDARKSCDSSRLERLHEIADTVFRYHATGHPIGAAQSKKKGAPIGAFRMAAAHHEINDSEAREAWELFGESLKTFHAGGLWDEPLPSMKKLNAKKRKTQPRK